MVYIYTLRIQNVTHCHRGFAMTCGQMLMCIHKAQHDGFINIDMSGVDPQ